jgi:hypothetical protein
MQTQLPRRPYLEQLPPPDGLGSVRREAARRRRRRAVRVATGGVTAAIVTAAALLVGGGSDGDAILRPAPAAPVTGIPTPGGVAAPHGKVAPHSHVTVTRPGAGGDVAVTPVSGAAARAGRQAPASMTAQVSLTRARSSYTGAPRFCRTGDSAEGNTVHPGANWCLAATAVRTSDGERLSLQVCRDSTSGGSLTFGSSREVDFVVKRAGTTVWSWSHAHPGSPSHHTLTAPADGCWNWTLVWPGVDQSGRAVGHGSYTVTSNSTADELYAGPALTATFQY